MNQEATVDSNGITGGTSVQTDEQFRSSILDTIQFPARGGSKKDYDGNDTYCVHDFDWCAHDGSIVYDGGTPDDCYNSTYQQLMLQNVAALGENIVIRRFERWELGESTAS